MQRGTRIGPGLSLEYFGAPGRSALLPWSRSRLRARTRGSRRAAHDQRADSGAHEDGGKAETDKPAPDSAPSETEGGVRLFPEGKGPGGS